jgi:hypothetical protein
MLVPFSRTRELTGPLHDTVDKGSTADGSHWFLESARERVANVIKEGQQLLARNSHRANAHDRDQRAN